MKCPFVIKVCTKCKKILVANTINFSKKKSGKWGLHSLCRTCCTKQKSDIRRTNKKIKKNGNPFDNIDSNKVWNHCPFCIKVCTECGKILVANGMNFRKRKGGKYNLRAECKQCEKEYNKDERKEYLREYNKQYREDNKEYFKKYKEQWRENHKEELKEYNKEYMKKWKEDNPEKIFNNSQKRRHKLENQGNGITKEQWIEMMDFFDWKCAYSDIQLDKNNRSIDHIIPLNAGGLNEPWNCVPMYMPYNSSKRTNDIDDWYKKQDFFDIDRLQKIYEWQKYAYNKWGGNDGKES